MPYIQGNTGLQVTVLSRIRKAHQRKKLKHVFQLLLVPGVALRHFASLLFVRLYLSFMLPCTFPASVNNEYLQNLFFSRNSLYANNLPVTAKKSNTSRFTRFACHFVFVVYPRHDGDRHSSRETNKTARDAPNCQSAAGNKWLLLLRSRLVV